MEGISDIIIQNVSGVPYIARCYGGTYCRSDPNHTLVAGFFSAINSFKGEFNQRKLKIVGFDELSLVFEDKDDFLVILGLEKDITDNEESEIRNIAKDICNEFTERYGEIIKKSNLIKLTIFDDFIKWVDDRVELASMGEIRSLLEEIPTEPNVLSRLINKIRKRKIK